MTIQQDLGAIADQPELATGKTTKKTTATKKAASPKKTSESASKAAPPTPKTKKTTTPKKSTPPKTAAKTSPPATKETKKTIPVASEPNTPAELNLSPNLPPEAEKNPDNHNDASPKNPRESSIGHPGQTQKSTAPATPKQQAGESKTNAATEPTEQRPLSGSSSAEKKSRLPKKATTPKTQATASDLSPEHKKVDKPAETALDANDTGKAIQKTPQRPRTKSSVKKAVAQPTESSKSINKQAENNLHLPVETLPEVSANSLKGGEHQAKEPQKGATLESTSSGTDKNQIAKPEQNKKKSPDKEADLSLEAEVSLTPEGKPSSSKKNPRKQRQTKKSTQEITLPDAGTASADTTESAAASSKESALEQAKENAKLAKNPRRKMFVCVQPEEQVEVALTEEGQVQEYYVEMFHQMATKGNIYKGIIHNIDTNLQAAFINYGAVKNGFLQIDEIHPEYYNVTHEPNKGRKYPPIQKVLQPGQEVLVQVVKEPSGTKGAFLTTYLSIPGRFLVLTPGSEQIGVSRKVDNEAERARLREMLEGLTPDPGLGVIVRTVSIGTSKENLEKDLEYLQRIWKEVRTKGSTLTAPTLIYQEHDLATRAIRDYLTDAVTEIWVDDPQIANAVEDTATALFPKKRNLVRVHTETLPLFERFNLQKQIDQLQTREVSLPSGGRLVIDATEALTAIDINSGRSSGKNNFEDMAYRTNLEAARIIPLQLRLRDIGGQIVVDFIEMRNKNHWREVEKTLRQGMKNDRARFDIGKISVFGLQEIVRQRLGTSALSISTEPCPHCKGTGVRRNMEWQCQQALREITRLLRNAASTDQKHVVYAAEPELALQLLNNKRQRLTEMEQQWNIHLEIRFKHAFPE